MRRRRSAADARRRGACSSDDLERISINGGIVEDLGHFLTEKAEPIAFEVMADWTQLGSNEPWHRLPPRMDHDHLPDVIRKLAATALITFFDPTERTSLAWACVQHGQHRFDTGVAEETVAREFELLRWALWRRLKREADIEVASSAIIRLDSAIAFAHGASLRGYHRRVIEAGGDWPAAVERYIDEWTFR
jgi:hypothetical protein